ncbi:hypothetical protein FGF1_38320 [Flavobacteriaceae bacterium GF1]
MTISIGNSVPLMILFQSILFAFVLISDRGPKRISNYYLAFFMLVLGLQFVAITFGNLQIESDFVVAGYCVYGFIYGPALYLYTGSLVFRSFRFRFKHVLHLIPAAVLVFFVVLGYHPCQTFGVFLYVSLVIYVAMAIKELVSYRKIVRETQSTSAKTDLKWLQWTILFFITILLLDIADQFLWSMHLWYGFSIIHLSILFLVNWMFYKGLRQPQIFLGITDSEALLIKERTSAPHPVPTEAERSELERVKQFVQNSQIFCNPELTLTELADTLAMAPRKLSSLINNYEQQNFVSFINAYRIEMAKERLKNVVDKNETILEVMYAVGFNSKSSFNTLFKRQTGCTPSEFKKRQAQ